MTLRVILADGETLPAAIRRLKKYAYHFGTFHRLRARESRLCEPSAYRRWRAVKAKHAARKRRALGIP